MLDWNQIRESAVRWTPYPYFVVNESLTTSTAKKAAEAFPRVDRPGAVDVEETEYGAPFGALLDEFRSDRFRALISEKLEVDLTGRDLVINVRGQTKFADGIIHTDIPSKLITVLLYFNEPGQAEDAGLRILNNGRDLDDYVEEISPALGTMVAFKVTPNCWHGHKPFVGKRHSLQLNYLSGIKPIGKHQYMHRVIGRMKRKLARLMTAAA